MASATAGAGAGKWLKGKVKAVPSGDTLVIMGNTQTGIPPEKTITLSSLIAPRLAGKDGVDKPFAWESREFLRKLCIGKDVTFKVDYTVPAINREFATVVLGDKYVAFEVVAQGWAQVKQVRDQGRVKQVKDQGQQKVDASPFLADLLRLEEQAKRRGVGLWGKAAAASIRNLPPYAANDLDAKDLVAESKGTPIEAIVEYVRDGSCLRVFLLPDYKFVPVFVVAGVQAPSMGRRVVKETNIEHDKASVENDKTSAEVNGATSSESSGPSTSLEDSSASSKEVASDPFAKESKHFTETRVLHRDVRIVPEGFDSFNNLIGSVYYADGESAKDLALELVQNGLAKYVEWSASMLDADVKRQLKSAELEAKKSRLRMWMNYKPPASDSKEIHDQNFTGKVVEVVSGDCIIVSDDSFPSDSPLAERRINLSSIRRPRTDKNDPKGTLPPYAREAKELLRTRLIGRQVHVSMEYSRKVNSAEGRSGATGQADRTLDFGTVFLVSPVRSNENTSSTPATNGNQQPGINVAELLIARGFGEVVRHRDFEVRSSYYDALLAAESRAKAGKKGMHSGKEAPATHVKDLLAASAAKKAKDFLPYLQKKKMNAVVEYVFSGHRFKLYIPKETCNIAFSLSGVRCPGRDEPYSKEAIALMRKKILQRDVEIEVETCDRTGTFLGSLWESNSNLALTLLEAGLAKLTPFGAGKNQRIPDFHLLAQAEKSAKKQKLKVWENYVEGQEVSNGSATQRRKQKEEMKVVITDVLDGGKFYIQAVADQKMASIQQKLASLKLSEAPIIGEFNPKKGDLVLAQFSQDNSWNRALIVNAPQGAVESPKDKFEVFYIDYGNQEVVSYSLLRPLDPSLSSTPGLAQLCRLAYIKVPRLDEEYGHEAAVFLAEHTLQGPKELKAVIVDRDTAGGKNNRGKGTGTTLVVILVDEEANTSLNAMMLKEGLARLERRRRYEPAEKERIMDELEKDEEEARSERLRIWEYGDIMSDDEDNAPPIRRRAAGVLQQYFA